MKKKRLLVAILMCMLFLSNKAYSQENTTPRLNYTGSLAIGYNRGFGIQTSLTAYNFGKSFPVELRLGLGLTFLNPGNADDARRIFVNDATNGVPEKSGRSFDFRLDFMFPKTIFGNSTSFVVLGPRFSTYRGHFDFVDGNEVFDVTSTQWGVGIALENHFRMTDKLSLFLNYGVDGYIPSTLTGHDSAYSPDNSNVNPKDNNRNDGNPFQYKDANKAIYQPFIMPRVLIGLDLKL